MKLVLINLESVTEIHSIRTGQMFQVDSRRFGCFKSAAEVKDGVIFFKSPPPKVENVCLFFVDTLYRLDPLK